MWFGVTIALVNGMHSIISKNIKEHQPQVFTLENFWLIDNHPQYENLPIGNLRGNVRVRPLGRRLLAALVIIIAFLGCRALADSVNLTWDVSSDSNVVGYEIYYGTTSGVYTNVVVLGNVASTTITNLTPGLTYYFNATDRDVSGNESAFSGETAYAAPFPVNLTMGQVINQGVKALNFTASGEIPASWRIEMSTDLVNWVPFYYGVGPVVNVVIPIANVPKQFFRLSKN
jgi:hypothetical protein